MAINGTMTLNGADYAPFNLYGVGIFMAHSGQGTYRNQGTCGAIQGAGPIPRVNIGLLIEAQGVSYPH